MPDVRVADITFVVIVKLTVVSPAGTTTDPGSKTCEEAPAERFTFHPPFGAADFRVMVPVVDVPAAMLPGLTVKVEMPLLITVKLAECQMTESWALSWTVIPGVALSEFTVNVADDAPSGTVTVAGIVT